MKFQAPLKRQGGKARNGQPRVWLRRLGHALSALDRAERAATAVAAASARTRREIATAREAFGRQASEGEHRQLVDELKKVGCWP